MTYDYRDAYGIILNKVPNLGGDTEKNYQRLCESKTNQSRGLVSNPRPFLPENLANQHEVSICVCKEGLVTHIFLLSVTSTSLHQCDVLL